MNRHRADSAAETETDESNGHAPRPIVWLFAAAFVVAMFLNMHNGGSDTVTIFLGCGALLTIGVDVGKLTGRR